MVILSAMPKWVSQSLHPSIMNPKVFLDISISGEKIGRIVVELFEDKAPKSASNFYHLCEGDVNVGGHNLTYKGNHFHRVIKNFMVQAGDIVFGSDQFEKTDNIGKGGCSIYAAADEWSENDEDTKSHCYGSFEDENMGEFTDVFYLAMANTGAPNTNSSQFFITTYPSPHLNAKHSIFGRVLKGKSVVRTMEYSDVDSDGFPKSSILIENCGKWDESMDVPLYNASNDPIGGDIYEEYPDDDKNFDPESFSESYKAANKIKESGTQLFKKKDFQGAFFKYRKALRYVNEYIPDMDVDEELSVKFTVLKMKLYLNISLVLFNLKKYDSAITHATYLLEMEKVPTLDKAKAYYRRGNCYRAKNRLEEALKDYKNCKENNPDDKVIDQKIESVENLLEERKEKTRKNIAKFFS